METWDILGKIDFFLLFFLSVDVVAIYFNPMF